MIPAQIPFNVKSSIARFLGGYKMLIVVASGGDMR